MTRSKKRGIETVGLILIARHVAKDSVPVDSTKAETMWMDIVPLCQA
jgi:hypothetical protein